MQNILRRPGSLWPFAAALAFIFAGCWITQQVPIADWRLLHGDSIRAFLPGTFDWETILFDPFAGGRICAGYLWMVAYYLCTTLLFGMALVESLFVVGKSTPGSWPALGYLAGYLALVAINRLLTIAFSHQWAVGLTLAAPLPPALWFLWSHRGRVRSQARSAAISFCVVGGAFFFFLVFQIEFGRNFLAGDSTIFFLKQLANLLPTLDPAAHFPLVEQQYDEVIYSYPLIFHPSGREIFLFPFWVVNSLGKAATAIFLFSFVRARIPTKSGAVLAGIGILYLFLGGPTLRPVDYISLFGGQNPLIYNGHIGRMIGLVIPVLFIDLLWPTSAPCNRFLSWPAAVLLGLGLGGTSVHNLLFAGVFLFAAHFFAYFNGLPQGEVKLSTAGDRALLLGVLLAPPLTYVSYSATMGFWGNLLLFAAVVGAYLIVPRGFRFSWKRFRGYFPRKFLSLDLVVASAFLSLFLLGNTLLPILRELLRRTGLGVLFPSVYSEPYWSRHLVHLAVKWFSPVACGGYPSYHCVSIAGYATYYGLFFLAATVLFVLAIKNKTDQYYQRVLLLFCILFCYGLYSTDFIQGPAGEWVKNRLIEIPYYLMFLFLPIGIAQARNLAARITLAGLLLIWAVVPFVVNHGPAQWWVNWNYLLNL